MRQSHCLRLIALLPALSLTLRAGYPEDAKAPSLADKAPASSLVFVETDDIGSLKAGLGQTPLGKLIDPENPSAGAGLLFDFLKLFLRIYSGATADEWMQYLEGPLAFLVPPPGAVQGAEPPIAVAFRLAGGPERFTSFKDERVLPTLLDSAPHLIHSSEEIGDATCELIRDEKKNDSWFYAVTGDQLIIGSGKGTKGYLQARAKGAPPLASSEGFVAGRGHELPDAHLRAYFNIAQVIAPVVAKAEMLPQKKRELQILGLLSLADISASLRFENGAAHERILLRRSEAEPTGFAQAFTQPKPRALQGAAIVPQTMPLFVNVNLGDGLAFRAAVEQNIRNILGPEATTKLQEGRQFVEQTFMLSLEQEVWGNLTGEVVLAMDIPDFKENVLRRAEWPKKKDLQFFVGLSIKNRQVARAALMKFLDSPLALNQGLTHQEQIEGDGEIILVKHPKKPSAFGLLDDFLLFSWGPEAITRAIRARAEGRTLSKDPQLQETLKLYGEGQNLVVRFDVRKLTLDLAEILEKAGHPLARLVMEEFKPVLAELGSAVGVGHRTEKDFVLDVYSPEGAGLHFLSIAVLLDVIKKSPGARAGTARREMNQIAEAVDQYFIDNGTFPPTLEALRPKYIKRIGRDPFANKPYRYSPGPITKEGDLDLHTTAWILLSRGPDGVEDLPLKDFDIRTFLKRSNSGAPADEEYLCRITYQHKPEKYKLENRVLDRGDLYVLGTPPH